MKEKNGFTLIELLAIIIILAIIAVITVPIILNIIDDSKSGAAINSAYGYRDAINKFYMSKMVLDNNYEIEDGEYDISYYVNEGLDVSGDKPSAGWVEIENAEVTDFSFKIGDYAVTYVLSTDTIEAVKDGELAETRQQREIRLAKEAAINSANIYVSALEDLTTKITSQAKNVSELNELVVLDSEPSMGWVQFDSTGNSLMYSLKFGDYVVNYDSELSINQQTVTTGNTLRIPIPGDVVNGVKYYDAEWVKANPVQYNPGHVAEGNTVAIEPGKCTSGDGCKTWYPYSEFTQNGEIYVNMIMDKNTTAGVKWASQDDYMGTGTDPVSPSQNSTQNSVGISYPEGKTTFAAYGSRNNEKGPLTVLRQLHTDTDSWNLSFRTDSYTPASNNKSNYTIDYSGYKARLISPEEIALITRKNTATSSNAWTLSSSGFYFGTLSGNFSASDEEQLANQRKYSWLFDYTNGCINYGCVTEDSSTSGYWSSSPSGSYSYSAWRIYSYGYLGIDYVDYVSYGIRPVITVLVSEVF